MPDRTLTVVILAGGQGKRMGASVPKVLVPVKGRPMIEWVVEQAEALHPDQIIIVESPERLISAHLGNKYTYAVQAEPKGTAHALAVALEAADSPEDILVLNGDTPMADVDALRELVAAHRSNAAEAGVLSAEIDIDIPYARIIRDAAGSVIEILQDLPAEMPPVKEMYVGPVIFNQKNLAAMLAATQPSPVTGELYLPELVRNYIKSGHKVVVVRARSNNPYVWGVNSPDELEALEDYLAGQS